MPLDIVALSSILLLPLASVPAATGVSDFIEKNSPEHCLESWAVKVQTIVHTVCQKQDKISDEAMSLFIAIVRDYIRARIQFEEQISRGESRWFWKTRVESRFAKSARVVWKRGLAISTDADAIAQTCVLHHKNKPTHTEGRFKGKCLECYPPEEFKDETDLDTSLSWAVILESAMMGASKQGAGNAGENNIVSPDVTAASSQGAAESHHVAQSTTATLPTVAVDDAASILSDIPLDLEESYIMGEVVENNLLSAGLSWEDIRAWKSVASVRDMERGNTGA